MRHVSLTVAATHCELHYGADWYYNPRRWPTADGYVPYRVLWSAFRRLEAWRAVLRLDVARAVSLAHVRDRAHAEQRTQEELRTAFPDP